MVALTLPKNSKVIKGKTFNISEEITNKKIIEIYRYDPDTDSNPRLDVFEIDICLLYTSPSPRDGLLARMPSSA